MKSIKRIYKHKAQHDQTLAAKIVLCVQHNSIKQANIREEELPVFQDEKESLALRLLQQQQHRLATLSEQNVLFLFW